jgi:hypothetical protein
MSTNTTPTNCQLLALTRAVQAKDGNRAAVNWRLPGSSVRLRSNTSQPELRSTKGNSQAPPS